MIETPPSLAIAPDNGHDVLAESLRAVRLTGSVFLDACFTAPFGIISPKRFDANSPMAHLRHVSVFHLISKENAMSNWRTANAEKSLPAISS